MIELCEEIHSKVIMSKLGFGVIPIATDKIIASGNSFGGMTAIRAAQVEERFRACLTLDPWLYCYEEEIING